jgi:hypothetical protein
MKESNKIKLLVDELKICNECNSLLTLIPNSPLYKCFNCGTVTFINFESLIFKHAFKKKKDWPEKKNDYLKSKEETDILRPC